MERRVVVGSNIPNDKRVQVMLAVPHTGTISMNLHLNILHMMNDPEFRVVHQPIGHRRPVDAARNEICKIFLQESRCEYLLMIDADMADDPDYITSPRFLRLASCDKDIVGALGLMWKDEEDVVPTVLVYDAKAEGLKVMKSFIIGDLIECDATGSGVLMIRRRVLEKLEPPYFKYTYNSDGTLKLGQDFYFCQKAREAGFRIYVHTGILTSHWQQVDLLSIFKRRAGLSPQRGLPEASNIQRIK